MPPATTPAAALKTPGPQGGGPGLLLLTGGESRRYGSPKHLEVHPTGLTWGGHLVQVFLGAFPAGPLRILGSPLPEHPDLPLVEDPRQGPARALAHWAARETSACRRWWVLGCDQVHWTVDTLLAWHEAAAASDPEGRAFVVAETASGLQTLGGFLGGGLLRAVAESPAHSLRGLFEGVPHQILPWEEGPFLDVDFPPGR